MASLDPTERAKIQLAAGDQVRIVTSGQCTVQGLTGAPEGTTTLTASSQDFGPYGVAAVLLVTCVSGSTDYSLNDDAAALTAQEKRDFDAMLSAAGGSTMGVQRVYIAVPVPPVDTTGGVAKTFDVQIPAKRAFRGVRFGLVNLNTAAAANYTAMRCGSAPKHLLSYGDEITWWPSLLTVNGSTSLAVPAAVAGETANHVIPSVLITDFVPLQPVARTDQPTGKPLARVRVRGAAEVQNTHNINSTYGSTWNAYVGADGMVIGSSQPTTDYVTSAPTDHVYQLTTNGGGIQPLFALFAYDDPGIQVWAFGDSLFQGVGTSVGQAVGNGCLGWPTLVHLQQERIDVLNMGLAGAKTSDSLAIMRNMLAAADDLPQYVAIKVYSPNDGLPTQALIDQVWGRVLNACSYARSRGVRVLLFTCPPVNTWTSGQQAFREEINGRCFALAAQWGQVRVVDMAAAVSDPSNRRQILPAYSYDATHFLDAGQQAIADAAVAAIT